MTNQEKTTKFKELFANNIYLAVKEVMDVNHNPHPYTIGTKHVEDAANNHGGRLGTETIQKIPCAVSRCNLSYDEHTSDNVLFLQLKQNVPSDYTGLQDIFKREDVPKVDGVAFVETTEKFRILKDEES